MTRARYGEGALIVCDNLVRIFKVADLEVVALQGLDLLVEQGEMMAIVGASGSGKSTLLNILGGLDAPSAGRAVVAGHDLAQMGRRERTAYRRRVVGMVWQQTARNLLPYLSALENVELPMILDGRANAPSAGPRAARARRPGRPRRPPAGAPVGRRAAARGDRRRAGQRAGGPARRRADRRARQRDLGRGLRAAPAGQRGAGTTIVVVTHDPLVSEQVARTVRIRDGRTSTETRRRTEQGDDGDHRVVAEEFAVLDRVGRLQLPEGPHRGARARRAGPPPARGRPRRRLAGPAGRRRGGPMTGYILPAIGADGRGDRRRPRLRRAATPSSTPCAGSTLRSAGASSSPSAADRGAARPRCSTSSAGWTARRAGRVVVDGVDCPR